MLQYDEMVLGAFNFFYFFLLDIYSLLHLFYWNDKIKKQHVWIKKQHICLFFAEKWPFPWWGSYPRKAVEEIPERQKISTGNLLNSSLPDCVNLTCISNKLYLNTKLYFIVGMKISLGLILLFVEGRNLVCHKVFSDVSCLSFFSVE